MTLFNLDLQKVSVNGFDLLKIGFGDPANNTDIVAFVSSQLKTLDFGGNGLLVTGASSLPVAAVISHHVAHLFGFVAFFDPKLQGFVVSISHTPSFKVGNLIDANGLLVK